MSRITLEQATTQRDKWLQASLDAADAQSAKFADREVSRASADHIMKMLEFWEAKVKELSGGVGRRVHYVVPE